jgi:hypothetical protein
MSNYENFSIRRSGLFSYETGTTTPFQNFITQKGKWNKRVIKSLGKMDNKDLNRFVKVYAKQFGASKSVMANEVYNITPNFKNQKKIVFFDNKFFIQRTLGKKINPTNAIIDNQKIIPQSEISQQSQYKNYIIGELKKMNDGLITDLKVDNDKITLGALVKLVKSNIIDKKVIANTDGDDWITFSDKTINKIVKGKWITSMDAGKHGSDAKYVHDYQTNQYSTIRVVEWNDTYANSIQPKNKNGGAFFRFMHNVKNLDLRKYGIFHKSVQSTPKNIHDNNESELVSYLNDNCLYHTLKELELEEMKLSDLKSMILNRTIPLSKMNYVCEMLQISIKLRKIKGKTKDNYDNVDVIHYGDKKHKQYFIGLLDDHFFPIMTTDITSYALKNRKSLLGVADWRSVYKTIDNKAKTQQLYKRDKNRCIDSFLLIKTLLQNKETLLTPIQYTDAILETQFYDKVSEFGSLEYGENSFKPNPPSVEEIEFILENYEEELMYARKEIKEIESCSGRPLKPCERYGIVYSNFTQLDDVEDDYKLQQLSNFLPYYQRKSRGGGFKVFFDFETYADNKEGKIHKPYLCCMETETGEKQRFLGKDCARKFLDNLPTHRIDEKGQRKKIEDILLIAHNSGYDYKFLFPYLSNKKPIQKGKMLMSCSATYYHNEVSYIDTGGYKDNGAKNLKKKSTTIRKISITIKDSYAIIPEPLRKFGKMFELEQGKEVIPYKLYNKVFSSYGVSKIWYKEKFVYKAVKTECGVENLEIFKENCKKWNCINNGEINIMEYSAKYCEIDCDVLRNGYEKFSGWIKKLGLESEHQVNLNIDGILSCASLAHKYLISQGCYEGVMQLAGKPREFIQRCVVGGRTMTNSNKKWKVSNGKIADFDACSLYPSAMYLGNGFLKGLPKVLSTTNLKECLAYDGIFVRGIITKVGKHRQFPLCSVMTDSGVRDFTNDLIGKEVYLDKQALLDLIEFQDADYQIVEGYYYDEGHNQQIKKTIRYLYDTRVEKKQQGNPIQAVYKLIMNSAYGKSILKPITEDIVIVSKTGWSEERGYYDKWTEYLGKNYNYIKEFIEVGKEYIVKKFKPIDTHFNNAQVGVEVLSMSKNIMNKVMCLSEDIGLKIYTQDTDSMHIDYDEVEILGKEYTKKYNTNLIGSDMGQFHIDFDLKGSVSDIVATESIFLGKKCYIDKLKSTNQKGETIWGHHIRMKGVPEKSIEYTADILAKQYEDDKGVKVADKYLHLYDCLYKGDKINFDLLCGGKVDMFKNGYINEGGKYVKDSSKIHSVGEFNRSLLFKYEEGKF